MAMTEERRLKKIVINIMRQPLFADWSGILMLGKKEVRDDVPTACTDGRDEYYGRAFMQSLSDKELAFVVLHEAGHKMLRQLTMWRRLFDQNPQLANMAADYVVNLMLHKRDPKEDHIALPRKDGKLMVLLDTKYDNMNTKQVFDSLKEQMKKQQCKSCGGSGKQKPDKGDKDKSKGDSSDKGQDDQSGQGDKQDGDEQGHGSGGDKPCPDCGGSGMSGNGQGSFDEHDWKGAKEMSQQEKEELQREIDQAIRQGQIAAQRMGTKGTGGMNKELSDLLDPKVDWRELLREFVTSTCAAKDASSWRKVNRRFIGHDVYLPSLIGESVEHIAICPDMSGSTWAGDTLQKFFSEMIGVANMVKPQKLDLIYWDTQVTNHETFRYGEYESLANVTQPKGGGGTNVAVVFDHIEKTFVTRPDVCIVLTDGYTPWPAQGPDYPVMFVMVGSREMAPFGKTIHIED